MFEHSPCFDDLATLILLLISLLYVLIPAQRRNSDE